MDGVEWSPLMLMEGMQGSGMTPEEIVGAGRVLAPLLAAGEW